MDRNRTPSSHRLASSNSSLSPSSSKQISQAYKQSSQLFLTRRLQESLAILEPVITVPSHNGEHDGQAEKAPIASASSNMRIKVWNLYITILNSVVDIGAEEGRRQFGQKEWKALASKVRDGDIWDSVVQVGYGGREGSVDAEVVYNLATLLLSHSPSQKLNQQRLETYLSSYGLPDLDVEAHLQNSSSGKKNQRIRGASGTDTPKDLAARIKILELFTLHVLPRNEEWDYAKEFINLSEVLDEERKETFLQTLDGLREEKERGTQRAAEIQREKEEEMERQRQQEEERIRTEQIAAGKKSPQAKGMNGHRRSGSEVDYGIENTNPNGALKPRNTKPSTAKATKGPQSSGRTAAFSPTPDRSKQVKRSEPSKPIFRQVRMFANLVIMLAKNAARSMSANPLSFLRMLLLLMGVIMALGRPDVRDRVRRVTQAGWQKVRGTVGMGVKVSYI